MSTTATVTIDVESVYGSTVSVSPGQTASGSVTLPTGYLATGGGFVTYGPLPNQNLPAEDLVPLLSGPTPSSAGDDEATGWQVYMKNTSPTDTQYFQPWVLGIRIAGS